MSPVVENDRFIVQLKFFNCEKVHHRLTVSASDCERCCCCRCEWSSVTLQCSLPLFSWFLLTSW